jgi:hypothetical protein
MTKKYVVGFTGHFYVEAENQAEANIIAANFASDADVPGDGVIRLDYVDWVI